MIQEKYLPIGSIVQLKKGKKYLMITGYAVSSNKTKIYDYTGCFYPEGIVSNTSMLFDHSEIEMVVSTGYINDEFKSFNSKLKDLIKYFDTNQ